MAFLFAKPLTPAEQLKKHKREIDRAIRDLERERTKLQMQEKKIIGEIRKAAAQNQQVSCSAPEFSASPGARLPAWERSAIPWPRLTRARSACFSSHRPRP
eukprot:COSAG06_NODE_44101_length_366_cov_0.756554_1_plen_100_part_10